MPIVDSGRVFGICPLDGRMKQPGADLARCGGRCHGKEYGYMDLQLYELREPEALEAMSPLFL